MQPYDAPVFYVAKHSLATVYANLLCPPKIENRELRTVIILKIIHEGRYRNADQLTSRIHPRDIDILSLQSSPLTHRGTNIDSPFNSIRMQMLGHPRLRGQPTATVSIAIPWSSSIRNRKEEDLPHRETDDRSRETRPINLNCRLWKWTHRSIRWIGSLTFACDLTFLTFVSTRFNVCMQPSVCFQGSI